MLTPPPPYSRSFPTHFIEISSESEDEDSDSEDGEITVTQRPRHLTTSAESIMTQRNTPRSTRSSMHLASRPHTTLPSARQVSNADSTPTSNLLPSFSSSSTLFQPRGNPLLPSSMPGLRPALLQVVVDGPQYFRASTVWPSSDRTLDTISPQLSGAVETSHAPTPIPARTPTSTRVRTACVNSSPSALLSISNIEIDRIVADALDRYLSNQRPGMRATRVNLDGSYEDRSTIEFHDMGSPIAP